MKDPQVFGKQFDYIKIKGESMNKYPLKSFIELEGEPAVESLFKEDQDSIQREYNEDLNEDIEKHEVLNPLLFDENDELKPEIKEAIEKIVNQFVEDLKTDSVKIEVKDVILVGSNVSYNYTKDSDLDIHIIEYSTLSNLFDQIPFALQSSIEDGTVPYLPIHPVSLRKTWQHDDVAYNFILDFLYTMTPFSLDGNLANKLEFSRRIISNTFTNEQLTDALHSVASPSVERRFETPQLQKTYERRIDSWRK